MENFSNYNAHSNNVLSRTFICTVGNNRYDGKDSGIQEAVDGLHERAEVWVEEQGAKLLSVDFSLYPYTLDTLFLFKCSLTVMAEINEEGK